jgi:hypothetical protein
MVCGKATPVYFLFFHMASHEEEKVVERVGGPAGHDRRRRDLATRPVWRWASWVTELPAPLEPQP